MQVESIILNEYALIQVVQIVEEVQVKQPILQIVHTGYAGFV